MKNFLPVTVLSQNMQNQRQKKGDVTKQVIVGVKLYNMLIKSISSLCFDLILM